MKKILLISLFLILPKTLFGNTQLELPEIFFIKCDGHTINLNISWLVKVDRKNKTGEIKIPYVDNTLKICKEDNEQIFLKRDCKNGYDEFSFNKWDGSFKKSKPCKILDVNQKPFYK